MAARSPKTIPSASRLPVLPTGGSRALGRCCGARQVLVGAIHELEGAEVGGNVLGDRGATIVGGVAEAGALVDRRAAGLEMEVAAAEVHELRVGNLLTSAQAEAKLRAGFHQVVEIVVVGD